jgi:hypothetical protein
MAQKTLEQLKADLQEAQELRKNAKTDKDKSAAQELIDSVVTEAKEFLEKAETDGDNTAVQELIDSVKTDSGEKTETKNSKSDSKNTKKTDTKNSNKSTSGSEAQKAKETAKVKKSKDQLAIMDRYKVKELFLNSKGETFTSQNLAELSEKDKTKVKKITREAVENLIK